VDSPIATIQRKCENVNSRTAGAGDLTDERHNAGVATDHHAREPSLLIANRRPGHDRHGDFPSDVTWSARPT
jgi:hypothetical protein